MNENIKKELSQKVNYVKIWWGVLAGYMMLAWLILHYYLRYSEIWLLAALAVFLIISVIVCRGYVLGMIGNYFYFTRQRATAVKYFEKAVKLKTHHIKALHIYSVYLLQENRAEEALELLKREQKINTKVLYDKLIPLAMSSCYWVLGDIDKAIQTIEDLRKRYSYVNPDTMTTLGYFYLLKGDFDKAEYATRKAIEDNAMHAPAWDNLGQIEYKKGNCEKAEENFNKALELRPSMPESLYYSALIRKKKGDLKGAKEYLDRIDTENISTLSTITAKQVEDAKNEL